MITMPKTLLSLSIALALTACGDGGTLVSSSSAGKAVDGYLSGSQVVCDSNGNGIQDAGEASTTTNSTGDFTFSPACAATVVVTGGTNVDTQLPFEGQLKAPAGSAVATPLTSLMVDSGLTASALATALGLPAGTDVTKTDPMSDAGLLKKTLAVQQVIQQIANTMGNLANSNNSASVQALYSAVASSVSATLKTGAPLVNSNGTISSAVVTNIVKKSVETVAASTNSSLNSAKAGLSTFSADSVSTLIGAPVAAQASVLSSFTGNASALTAQTATLQTNAFISSAAKNFSTLLTTAVATSGAVNLSAATSSLTTLSTNTSDSTALASFSAATSAGNTAAAAVITNFVAAETAAPSVIATNTLSINSDQLSFQVFDYESATASLSSFRSEVGVELFGIPDTVSFAYTLKGSPIPSTGSTVSVGLEILDTASTRKVKVILDKVNLSVSGGTLTAVVPANAKVYAYGQTSSGAGVYKIITNTAENQLLAVSGEQLSFNVTKVINVLMDKAQSESTYPFGNLLTAKGTFSVKILVSNLAIARDRKSVV